MTTIFDSYQFNKNNVKEQFYQPKQQALSLSSYFLHRAYYLLALFSARGYSEAGLKLGDEVMEKTRQLLEFFLIKELRLVVCLRSFFFGCSKEKQEQR